MYYYYEHTQHCAPFHVINEFVHTIPAVISIPHSGTYLTQQMKQNLKLPTQIGIYRFYILFCSS